MPQRILVVDDDREIVRLVGTYLEQSGYQVLTAYNGEIALDILRRERPDLMILDLMLPDRDGYEVTRTVRGDATLAAMPIIVLTAHIEAADSLLSMELGSNDYVTKPFNPHELVARVRSVLHRLQGKPVPPRVIQAGTLAINLDAHQVQVQNQPVRLTPTEFSLLRVLAENPGRAFTRLELIEEGLGYSYEGLERTVDSHIKNLRHKLTAAGAPAGLIETVIGIGYRLAVGGDS